MRAPSSGCLQTGRQNAMKTKLLWFLGSIVSFFLHAETNEVAPGVLQIGNIQDAGITESSGVIPSSRPGYYWTHNDGGRDVLYAMTRDGAPAGQYKTKDVAIGDWEDVAKSGSRIYIADIGNNSGSRDQVYVYAVRSPNPRASGELRILRRWTLSYPGQPFDAESLVLSTSFGYVISKELNGGEAFIYRFPLRGKSSVTLEERCRLDVDAPPAGADLTADNRRLAVITREGAYLFQFRQRIPAEGKISPSVFVPFAHDGMEGCCFTRSGLLVTSESGEIFLFTDPMFRLQWRATK